MEQNKKVNEQYSLVPSSENELNVNPMSLLVYCAIRRHMNKESRIAFPSMETICKMCQMTRPTLQQHINVLEEKGYFKVTRRKRQSNIYHFPEIEMFEPFSLEFLDNQQLTPQIKAYIIALQQYMEKDSETMSGTITESNRALSKQIHMPESSIRKCNAILEQHGYLTQNKTTSEKIFWLQSLGQKIVFTLINHEERIQNNENKIDELSKKIEKMQKEIDRLTTNKQESNGNDFELYL